MEVALSNVTETTRAANPWRRTALAAVLLAGTALGGFAVGHTGFAAPEAAAPGTPVNPPGSTVTNRALPDFTDLVTQVKPAVVSITTKFQAAAGEDEHAQMPFPRQFPFPGMGPQARSVEARGSGFIVDANGTIITNTTSISSADPLTPDNDSSNNSSSKMVTVSNPAPVITNESVSKSVLWPPNHKMVDITVNYTVTDNCGTPVCVLSAVSNEPDNGLGDGDTANDIQIVDNHHVRLRAERSGGGTGRIYTITITCTDSGGGVSTKTVTVTVPHDQP